MLITVQECADPLGVDPGDTFLRRLVTSTDSWAKHKLGRQFERNTYTLYPHGYGSPMIFLRESPIRNLVGVRVDPGGQFGDDTVVDLSLLKFNPDPFEDDNRVTYAGFGFAGAMSGGVGFGPWSGYGPHWWPFPELPNAIQVTVEAGWWPADDTVNTPDIPDDIREKLVERVLAKYKQGSNEEMQSERQGDYSWSKFGETDERILKALRHYKR